jgi:hypothetical protein
MSTVQEIEHAIGKLSPQEVEELRAWMEEQHTAAVRPMHARLLSEAIALAESGPQPVMDEDFAKDMREIIANRKPRVFAQWD